MKRTALATAAFATLAAPAFAHGGHLPMAGPVHSVAHMGVAAAILAAGFALIGVHRWLAFRADRHQDRGG
jgi:hypothetical protein